MHKDDVLAVLQRHIGAGRGVHIGPLVHEITGSAGADLERRVRDLGVELRMEGYCVCAEPAVGYYLAANAEELDRSCRFLVDRAMTSLSQVSRMKKIAAPDLYQQLKIKT